MLQVSGVYFHTFLACCLFRPASFWFRSDEEKSTPPNNEPLVSPSILTEKVAVNGDPSSQRLRPMELPSPIMFCQACGDESMQRVRCNTEGSLGMSKYKPHVTLASMSDHGVHDGSDTGRTERTIVNQIDIRHIDTRHMCKSPFFSSCTGMNGMEPKQSFHFIDPTKLQMIYSKTSSISTLYGSSILQFPPELEQYDLDDSGMEKVQPTFGFCGVLADMFNFSLLKSYVAVFMLTTGFLAFFGQYNFIIFLPASLIERGITKYDKAMLTSISGAGDLFGRVLVAVCGDRIVVARYNVQAVGMIAVGVNIGVFVFADRFSWMAVHIVLYGFFGGIYIAFFGVVMIDFVGVKRMPKLLAVVVLIQGIGAALGQPLLGAIHDRTDSYHLVHVICSLSCLSGGLLLLCYPIILKLEGSRPEKYQLVPRTSTI